MSHQDPNVDVGVIWINGETLKSQNRRFEFFKSDEHVSSVSSLRQAGVVEGDGVYVLGFPMALVDPSRQYAICRTGVIARIRDLLDGSSNDFFVDALIFPGNSGGPVISRPESTAIDGTNRIKRASLIGIVKGYLPFSDAAISTQTGARILFRENSGLAAVVPADYVDETVRLAHKRLLRRLYSGRARKKARSGGASGRS